MLLALDTKAAQLNQKQISGLALHLIFHCFSLFNCRSLIKRITPKTYLLCLVQHCFEPFMCSDLLSECQLCSSHSCFRFSYLTQSSQSHLSRILFVLHNQGTGPSHAKIHKYGVGLTARKMITTTTVKKKTRKQKTTKKTIE